MCRGEMSFIFWLIIVGYSIYSVQCELTYLQTEVNLAFLVNRVNIMSLVNPKWNDKMDLVSQRREELPYSVQELEVTEFY